MKNIKKMVECRALYLQSIAWILDDNITLDDNFGMLLTSFAENYIEQYPDLFDLIYDYEIVNNNLEFHEEETWDDTLREYLKYYFDNFDRVIKLHDEIGYDCVDKISKLAELFCEYIYEVYEINNSLERKH